jgi:uncharacterized membrane protein
VVGDYLSHKHKVYKWLRPVKKVKFTTNVFKTYSRGVSLKWLKVLLVVFCFHFVLQVVGVYSEQAAITKNEKTEISEWREKGYLLMFRNS